ncbi:MAG: hypothetical protein R3F59_04460 [Myxococcota bacterium]
MRAARLAALALAAWAVALGAWVSAGAALGFALARRGRAAPVCAALLVLVGPPEVLWRVHRMGAAVRDGRGLSLREKVGVVGFDLAFAGGVTVAGFSAFGRETGSLALPVSWAGACPPERVARYGGQVAPGARLRRWSSALPMRSPRIRGIVRGWAGGLQGATPRALGPTAPLTWPSRAYFAADASNQVAAALNTPTTRLSGTAVPVDGRWRLDLTVDLAVAYPPRSTLWVGPFGLEEGLFHAAQPLLAPYCAEYAWSVWADDPALARTEPVRGPLERLTTWLLRAAGAGYR